MNMSTGYAAAATATAQIDMPVRPGSVTDTKMNLQNRIQSLADAVNSLGATLDNGGLLRPDAPMATGNANSKEPPSSDSALSAHLSDLGKRVATITAQIENLTRRIDV